MCERGDTPRAARVSTRRMVTSRRIDVTVPAGGARDYRPESFRRTPCSGAEENADISSKVYTNLMRSKEFE